MATLVQEPVASPAAAAEGEQRLVLSADWRTYCVLRELLDSPAVRMYFLRGALEIMSPSSRHELVKKMFARLVEMFALERGVPLNGYGSTTFKKEAKEAGAEPDECYVVGTPLVEYPDIVIEVVITGGGLPKLPIYDRFGVPEVWFWMEDGFHLYARGADGYEAVAASRLVPGLDFELLGRFLHRTDQTSAVAEYRDALRAAR